MSDVSKETLKKEIAGNYALFCPVRFYGARDAVRRRVRGDPSFGAMPSPTVLSRARSRSVRRRFRAFRVDSRSRGTRPCKWPPPPPPVFRFLSGARVPSARTRRSRGFSAVFSPSDVPVRVDSLGRPVGRPPRVFRSSARTINDARPRPLDGARGVNNSGVSRKI